MHKIIEDKLATAGIQQFSFQYLHEGNYQSNTFSNDCWVVVDARGLRDADFVWTNTLEEYKKLIDLAWETMQRYGRVAICCVAGRSRSNSIALGVLVKYFNMDFYVALKLIYDKVPGADIDQGHIVNLKKLFDITN